MDFLRRNASLITMALIAVLVVFTVPTMLSAGPQLEELSARVKELRELCQSMALNRPFHLRVADGKQQKLEDWLRANHAATTALPE